MLKVAIVDDHQLVRKSFTVLLNSMEDIEVVVDASNGKVFLEKLDSVSVDIVLLDIQMPVMDGYETCKVLSAQYPDLKILILSHLVTKETIHKALEAGAHGYLSKDAHPEQLEMALRTIHEKGFYFEPGLAGTLQEVILWDKKGFSQNDTFSLLSEREFIIIKMVCKGYDNAEIADKLSINIRTVETHRKRILDKTEAKNFTSVILMALKYKYIEIDELLTKP